MSDPCRPILFSVEEYVYIILHIFSVFLGTYVYLFHPRRHSTFDPCNLCTFEPTDCTFFCQNAPSHSLQRVSSCPSLLPPACRSLSLFMLRSTGCITVPFNLPSVPFFVNMPCLTFFSAFLHAPPSPSFDAAFYRSCFGQRGGSLYLLIYRVYLFCQNAVSHSLLSCSLSPFMFRSTEWITVPFNLASVPFFVKTPCLTLFFHAAFHRSCLGQRSGLLSGHGERAFINCLHDA